jgi:hypothetical protein
MIPPLLGLCILSAETERMGPHGLSAKAFDSIHRNSEERAFPGSGPLREIGAPCGNSAGRTAKTANKKAHRPLFRDDGLVVPP